MVLRKSSKSIMGLWVHIKMINADNGCNCNAQFVLDKMSLLCCTRDDTLKVLDLRMNQISTTLAWVYYNCKSGSRIGQFNESQCSITMCWDWDQQDT